MTIQSISAEILPPASACPPIDIKINDTILGTVVTMSEWIRNELNRLQNNVRPRHCEHYSELVALIEEPKLFESLKAEAPPLPPMFIHQDIDEEEEEDEEEEDDEMDTQDDYEEEDEDGEEGDGSNDNEEEEIRHTVDITREEADKDTMKGVIHNIDIQSDNIPVTADDATAINTSNTATTTFTTPKLNHASTLTKSTNTNNVKKHIKPLPPTWLCRIFIEIMRYCGRVTSVTINNAPQLLLTEFDRLRLNVKLGKAINATEFREKLSAILFGEVQMTEHLVKCWKLMCEWVTRPPLNNHQNAMKWIEMSLSAYIAAQRVIIKEYLVLRKQQQKKKI
jgi:hypothetical protein